MAKIEGVEINGNTLTVPAKAAEVYEQVGGRGEGNEVEPQVGDIVVYDAALSSYLTSGAAYVVNSLDCGDAVITDDDGDDYDTAGDEFTVYRKKAAVSEMPTILPADYVIHDGQIYRKEKRRAVDGETIVVTSFERSAHLDSNPAKNGAVFTDIHVNSDGDAAIDSDHLVYKREYNVLVPVTSVTIGGTEYNVVKRNANVGERILIVSEWPSESRYNIGAIGEVTKVVFSDVVRAEINDKDAPVNSAEYIVLVPVSGAKPKDDVEQPQQPQPARLKVGEFAKVVDVSAIDGSSVEETVSVGDVVEIIKDDRSHIPFNVKRLTDGYIHWLKAARLVRATTSEVHAAKIGDFKDGDRAVITDAACGNACPDIVVNKGKTVIVSLEGPEGYRGLKLTTEDGRYLGFANAAALRKVDGPAPTKPARVPVGSYVRITTDSEGLPKGVFAKVTKDDGSNAWPYRCELLDGSDSDWFYDYQFEIITEAEVEAELERQKWAAIGRKVGEYKAGDVVEVIEGGGASGLVQGDVVSVKSPDGNGLYFSRKNPQGSDAWLFASYVRLIVPAEQRFDRKSA